MNRTSPTRRPYGIVVLAALVILSLGATAAMAGAPSSRLFQSPPPVPPPNDGFANATLIETLPFSATTDNTYATLEPYEQMYYYMNATVWYRIISGSDVDYKLEVAGGEGVAATVAVWQGSALGSLTSVGYAQNSTFDFIARAGQDYYLQLGSPYWSAQGTLKLSVVAVPPPANNNFADARPITGPWPYTDTENIRGATRETDEPRPSCAWWYAPDRTIWYSYTADKELSLSAQLTDTGSSPVVAVYTGTGLDKLTEIGCRGDYYGWLTFRAQAGIAYYFQVANQEPNYAGTNTFRLDETPAPTANFYSYPSDPNKYEPVTFCDSSNDPVYNGFSDYSWDFGDGATGTGGCASHQFATDGDYSVWHKAQTTDGRTAEVTMVVQVRTHDVAITKVSVPQSASAGQTRQVVVGLRNADFTEEVRVELFKSAAGGWFQVGMLNQQVPVRRGNRTTDFNFSYTFTEDDAKMGKVTFRAVAYLVSARDALPADNETISLPTKVTQK